MNRTKIMDEFFIYDPDECVYLISPRGIERMVLKIEELEKVKIKELENRIQELEVKARVGF